MIRTIAVLVALAFAVSVGGCTNAPPPTRERSEFVIAADKICANLTDAVAPVRDKATRAIQDGRLEEAEYYARQAADSGTAFLDQLARLDPPAKDRADVQAWIAKLRRQQDGLRRIADAIADRDQPRATRVNEEIVDLARQTRRFAFDFGMQTCAK